MKNKIKIILADDHEIFRSGLKYMLNQHDEFIVIGEAQNGKELLLKLSELKPDIILLDIEMPEMNGNDTAKQLFKLYPVVKIIVLSNCTDNEYYSSMIIAGAKGFVKKKAALNELEGAILSVYEGKIYFSQELLQKLVINSLKSTNNLTKIKNTLTNRELEILKLIGNGLSNRQIAVKLFISPQTVNNHRSNLLFKTGTNNTASLIMFAIKQKLINVNPEFN